MAGARSSGAVPLLRGRGGERAMLDGLLEAARAGESGVLVVRGEAGIGKTALLEHAIASATDVTLLRAVGVESQMELAFAALHQVCAPLDEFVERLPAPQRQALEITFGVSTGAAPDRFLVALATLSLFSEAAQERPLLCVIDDAQWLDHASAQALGFVARRLLAEPVVLLFAARETTEALAGLPEMLIEGLDDAQAREVLALVIPGLLDDRVADQLVAEARGNPLALLELPRVLPSHLASGFGSPASASLAGRMEQSFLQRMVALPPDTQRLLLVAAAEPLGDPAPLWGAAERLGIAAAAREPAEAAGLIEIGRHVRFRHPLVRSAVYRAASPEQRRRVHRALAEATDAETGPERRAWHLAGAAAGRDEDVAACLERAAARAKARGGLAAAAAFLQRAAELTPEPRRSAERALAAAQIKYQAGALDEALHLLGAAEAGGAEPARVHLLHAQIAFAARRGSDAPPLLLEAARQLEAVDPPLARATYLDALAAALFAGRLARGGSVVEVAEAARGAPPPPEPPRAGDLLLRGLALLITDGPSVGAPVLKRALRALHDEDIGTEEGIRRHWLAALAAAFIWDDEAYDTLTARQIKVARDVGALTMLPLALGTRVGFHLWAGELQAAAALAEESEAVARATDARVVPYAPLMLAAFQGHEDDVERLIQTSTKDFMATGEGMGLTMVQQATAVLSNGLGRYEDALAAAAQPAGQPAELWHSTWLAVELIEAASRTGDVDRAADALEWLSSTARASGSDWGLGVEARSRALLSDGDAAESRYREAIERLQRTRLRLDLARAQLLYGEWLRRQRRRLDAREHLRTALEMFQHMDMDGFARRAARELSATGERARTRSVETREQLTAQEAQVARLARDGLSNIAIGERLFISQHTVAYHLRKVFTKLDIGSRTQLGRVLPESGPSPHLQPVGHPGDAAPSGGITRMA